VCVKKSTCYELVSRKHWLAKSHVINQTGLYHYTLHNSYPLHTHKTVVQRKLGLTWHISMSIILCKVAATIINNTECSRSANLMTSIKWKASNIRWSLHLLCHSTSDDAIVVFCRYASVYKTPPPAVYSPLTPLAA